MNTDSLTSTTSISRREFLQYAAAGSAAAALPAIALAATDPSARFVLVILRGALDGLGAVPAYGDSHYSSQRGELAIDSTAHKLNGLFALNPGLPHLYRRYQAQELIVFHAVATPYRDRSHFEGQDLLESGGPHRAAIHDGWMNRMLPTLPLARTRDTAHMAVALAQNVPLVLRGDASVNAWVPSRSPAADSDASLQRLSTLHSSDVYLADRLHTALAANGIVANHFQSASRDPLGQFNLPAAAAGRLLASDTGARVAVIEVGGWDTHANQGADNGQLVNRLSGLDQSLETLRVSLGHAWSKTIVLVATEFGRTVGVNGTRGTDHGTATCAFLLGGAVAGGKVIADWPGLADRELYQGRDLQPTLDLRSVFKGVLMSHLNASERDLEERVFPDSRNARPMEGLIRRV
jgi:uncharacterized protein (DUF1501 family)